MLMPPGGARTTRTRFEGFRQAGFIRKPWCIQAGWRVRGCAMVRLFGRPRLRRAVVGHGEAADASDARAIISRIFPITCIRLSTDTAWPTRHAGRAIRRHLRARVLWPQGSQHRWNDSKRQVSARHVSGGLFAVPCRAWVGGFFYPGSRYGESEYLFGSRVGVRPNPRVSATGGLTVTF